MEINDSDGATSVEIISKICLNTVRTRVNGDREGGVISTGTALRVIGG